MVHRRLALRRGEHLGQGLLDHIHQLSKHHCFDSKGDGRPASLGIRWLDQDQLRRLDLIELSLQLGHKSDDAVRLGITDLQELCLHGGILQQRVLGVLPYWTKARDRIRELLDVVGPHLPECIAKAGGVVPSTLHEHVTVKHIAQ